MCMVEVEACSHDTEGRTRLYWRACSVAQRDVCLVMRWRLAARGQQWLKRAPDRISVAGQGFGRAPPKRKVNAHGLVQIIRYIALEIEKTQVARRPTRWTVVDISGKLRKAVNKQASKQTGLSPNPLDVPSGVAKLCTPEFYLVGARMRETYSTRLGSVHLPGDARRTHVRRSRHLLFTTRRSKAVESLGSRGTGYT
ncbi:hypothetical protein CRG98_030218 [Punica granatum]|uniref:Uncharacterized protein n=1 Tax=Punica granatum TaxID=22663 RepID=A0A2I0IZH7_PUNGR|nr:hypothetical protein CRG98_030218 [Punica granatum]